MNNYNNSEVRRQDRLLDEALAIDLIKNGEYGVLSMIESEKDNLAGYGIPINYAWDGKDYIYFHCAPQGHKLKSLDVNPNVSFCIVGKTNVVSNKFTTGYESVVIRGTISRDLSEDERMKALELILDKYSPDDKVIGMKYAQKSFHRTEVLRLEITQISGKSKVVK